MADAASVHDEVWRTFGRTLERVLTCPEIQVNNSRFRNWREELQALGRKYCDFKSEYFVLFVGSSGAGKSRLINVLLGDSPLLPSAGEGTAVTAATLELRYQAVTCPANVRPSAITRYHIGFDLFTEDEFSEKRDQMTRELLEYWEMIAEQRAEQMRKEEVRLQKQRDEAEEEDDSVDCIGSGAENSRDNDFEDLDIIPSRIPPSDEDARCARDAHDWFEACYGTDAFKQSWASADDFRATFAHFPQKMKSNCKESCCLQSQVLQTLKKWLVQDNACVETGQLWPLVRKAKLWGPWQVLAPNLVFVDLPGTGDTNAIRNAIAQREFGRADFVCICSRVDRAATDHGSLEWLNKAIRDLQPGSAAYVATKCDDISKEEVVRDHGMRQHASKASAAQKRNELVKERMKGRQVPVFAVSARDYSRCIGLEGTFPDTFMSEADTEVPQLRQHVVDTMKERRIKW